MLVRLAIDYEHDGDCGIPGRESFKSRGALPEHRLYACPDGNLALRNHLAVRDYLRCQPAAAREYGELKERLAAQYPHDRAAYVAGKSDFLLGILAETGFSHAELDVLRSLNQRQ